MSQEKYAGRFIKVAATQNAILLKREGQTDKEGDWVPFSQIDRVSQTSPGSVEVEVVMSAWIAKKKDFI